MKKRINAVILTLALVSALVACGQPAPTASTSPAVTTAAQTSAAAAATVAQNATTAAVTAATGATATESEAAEIVDMELFVNHTWWETPEWIGPIPEYVTQKTGVRPVVTVAADMQQLPVMIASNELPELIYTDNTQNMQLRLANDSLTWAWDDLFAEYAPDFQWDEERAKLYRQPNGKFYTMLNNYSTKAEFDAYPHTLSRYGTPTVQKHLLEELGNPPVESLEDYFNVLIQSKEQFPDLIPVVINTNWIGAGGTSSMFLSQHGLDINGFSVDETTDEVMYYIFQKGRVDYYKYINALYRNGLMIPENFAFNNEDESYQYAYNLSCFSYCKGTNNDIELNRECAKLGIESDWIALEAALGGDRYKVYDRNIGWSGLYVSTNNKNPQKAADFVSYLETDEGMRTLQWGIEGETWKWHPEGYPEFVPEYYADADWRKAQGVKAWGILTGTMVNEQLSNYDPTNPKVELFLEQTALSRAHTVYVSALGLVTPEADSGEQNTLTKLNDMVKNEEMKIYLAESEDACVAAYEAMLATAEQMGVNELNVWANEKYQSAKEMMGD